MFTIGNDELATKMPAPKEGTLVRCPHCRKSHKLEFGEKVEKDGTKSKSSMLGFVTCSANKQTYLVSLAGKLL